MAERCRYVGSPYHKDGPSFAGASRAPRPDASICPRALGRDRELVESWLRSAIRAGKCGAWLHGFPRYAWYRAEDGTMYEARDHGSGKYHGYPLEPWQVVRGFDDDL